MVAAHVVGISASEEAPAFPSPTELAFLQEIATAVVDASRVAPGAHVGNIGPNSTGGTLIRPGGRNSYPAFWIRDYAMSLDSGLVTKDEQRHMLLLTASHQQDTLWELPSGSIVPPDSIPDHISFGNKPIFYPGTLEDYVGQGGSRWGKLPSLDDHFYFIDMVSHYVHEFNDVEILHREINGAALIDRLVAAFTMPPSRSDTHLVYAEEASRGVTFGFVDTIIHTGDLFFCSVLKYEAAKQLSELLARVDRAEDAKRYDGIAQTLRTAIQQTFATPSGLFKASTGKSGQPDVWGTAYAVYIGALDADIERKACQALADAYKAGVMTWRGNVRHVLTTDDFSDKTAWEATDVGKNRYQNGAYWGTPVGWVCFAIAKVDVDLARKLASEYIADLRDGDFRKGAEYGSPWECMHPDENHRQNPIYMTSVTCPLAAFRRLSNHRPFLLCSSPRIYDAVSHTISFSSGP